MKALAVPALALGLATTACGRSDSGSAVKLDSAHSIALDAVIPDGILMSANTDQRTLVEEVKAQLQFTMGQLNGERGVADMARLEVSLGEIEAATADSPIRKVHYAAKVLVAWDRSRAVPESYELVLPARGDMQGQMEFFSAFKSDCIEPGEHEATAEVFWYYYRPQTCRLAARDDARVMKLKMNLTVSGENTADKKPEYTQAWADGKLVVTTIFAKYEPSGTTEDDAGIAAYNQMYRTLRRTYGVPATTNVQLRGDARPGIQQPDIAMTFNLPQGTLDVRMLLVNDIQQVDANFERVYNERTAISDYVSYSGHSGLGANIRKLATMGSFTRGQWQLFLVNGCDTFAYVDNALRDAHMAANRGAGPWKHFDIITNAMPSFFHMNTRSNMAIIEALVGKTETYRELLGRFDPNQKAVVTGEQDNGEAF